MIRWQEFLASLPCPAWPACLTIRLHACLSRFSDLKLAAVARSFCLLRLPKLYCFFFFGGRGRGRGRGCGRGRIDVNLSLLRCSLKMFSAVPCRAMPCHALGWGGLCGAAWVLCFRLTLRSRTVLKHVLPCGGGCCDPFRTIRKTAVGRTDRIQRAQGAVPSLIDAYPFLHPTFEKRKLAYWME